ncbi:MAG TPA: CoA transferase [Ramlibacter sp.]|nr:CoA transferase [Ramlibacter sp.]
MLPLAGFRVLELTHVWAGPLCGQVLADLGAEVIRIESRAHLDIHRRGGPYAGAPGVNRSGTWNAQNRNKLGCALDVKQAEGRQLLLDLVARSDVLIENFTPGTLDRLRLGFDVLRAANDRIVLLSLSGYGHTGPLRDSLAYGPMMDAATGLSAATTYADGIPRAVNGWAADVGGALHGCACVVRALAERTGRALHIDLSQFEAGALFLAAPLLEALRGPAGGGTARGVQLTAESREPDRWVAASAASLREATPLFDLLCGRARSAGLLRRWRDEGAASCARELQAPFTEWAARRDQGAALRELAAAGVPAVPITTVGDLLSDPELARRSAFTEVEHAEVGPTRNYGPVIRFEDDEGPVPAPSRPAPLLGGDNDHVFRQLLGLSPERIAQLAERGVI